MTAPTLQAAACQAPRSYALCSGGCGRQITRGRLEVGVCAVCAGERHPRHLAEALIEDAQWLADAGESWHGVLDRLDVTSGALERALYRHGRADLIRRLRARVAR